MQGNPANNIRTVLYVRVSTEEQRQGLTIDSQIEELERFANSQHWEVAEIYKEDGWTGSILARPELDRLRDAAAKGLFQRVLINDIDRLARDVTHLGIIKRDLERHNVQVIFRKLPGEQSPAYNLMVNILGSFAEFEKEQIADRTRRGRRYKVETLKMYLGSIPSYGLRYRRKDRAAGKEGVLEVDSEEAAVVRQMYAWVDEEGLSARKVLDRLNEMRLHPRKGSTKWAKSSVLRILRSEVYAGVWHYYKFEACKPKHSNKALKYRKTLKSSRRLRARTEWLPVVLNETLQIISRDQWQRVQLQLDRNIAFSPRNEKHSYFLKGLIHCAGCRARYVGEPCHGRFYYRCISRCKTVPAIQEGRLNDAVWAAIERAVLNPQLIADQLTQLNQKRANDASKMGAAVIDTDQALLQIQNEEARLIEAYRLEILSPGQLSRELENINLRKVSLAKRKAEFSNLAHNLSLPTIRKSIIDYCQIAAQRLKSFGPEERQRFLRLLVRDIVFDGGTARIKGVIPVSSEARAGTMRPEQMGSASEHLGGIATTTLEHCGRNSTSISPDFFAAKREADTDDYFTFELVQHVPRPIHSRIYLRQNDTQEGDTTSQIAA
jgi:site-specific DNA recombinase